MIAINVLVYLFCGNDLMTTIEEYGLDHGVGLTPLQWVTSNFVHAGFFHILINMVFLWGFGIIVEGKVGWYHFIPIYLGIGVTECIIEQVIFSSAIGLSFGASAIIFGLMVISLIWAPVNELTVFYWLFIRFFGLFDISIVVYSLLTLLKSLVFFAVLGEYASSELLHLLGAGVGAVVAVVYLSTGLVDCESWDLFSVILGKTPSSDDYLSERYQEDLRRRNNTTKAKRKRPVEVSRPRSFVKATPDRFEELLEDKKATAAYSELVRIRQRDLEWSPLPSQLLALARGLRRSSAMKDSLRMYEEFLTIHPKHATACLEAAEILVYVDDRPSAGMRHLQRCDADQFSESQRDRYQQVSRHAQAMIDDGVIEIDFQQ